MSASAYIKQYERGIDFTEHLDGISWYDADPPPSQHNCWAQTRAIYNGGYIERCPCGAFGPAPFFMLHPDTPRVIEKPRTPRFKRRGFRLWVKVWGKWRGIP